MVPPMIPPAHGSSVVPLGPDASWTPGLAVPAERLWQAAGL